MDEARICGILTERDYVWRVAHGKDDLLHGKVSDVMNPQVHRIAPESSLDGAMRLMTNHRVRHLVVEENARAIGMISIGDVVSTLLEDQTAVIDELRRHIREPQEFVG
jgi:CBS domain-containing protein